MARRFISNKNESVRMFDSDFIEHFSHIHPATPVALYLPVVLYMIYLAGWERGQAVWEVTGLFLGGLFIWTFVEYSLHRWVFHYQPKTSKGKRLHFLMHGVHHDYPNDATRLVMAPGVSVPMALVFYLLFLFLFGSYTPGVFAGMVFGYICYDTLHYATHHFPMKRGVLLWLKQYHMRHHYQDDEVGFGVSTPIWDYVFGTKQGESEDLLRKK